MPREPDGLDPLTRCPRSRVARARRARPAAMARRSLVGDDDAARCATCGDAGGALAGRGAGRGAVETRTASGSSGATHPGVSRRQLPASHSTHRRGCDRRHTLPRSSDRQRPDRQLHTPPAQPAPPTRHGSSAVSVRHRTHTSLQLNRRAHTPDHPPSAPDRTSQRSISTGVQWAPWIAWPSASSSSGRRSLRIGGMTSPQLASLVSAGAPKSKHRAASRPAVTVITVDGVRAPPRSPRTDRSRRSSHGRADAPSPGGSRARRRGSADSEGSQHQPRDDRCDRCRGDRAPVRPPGGHCCSDRCGATGTRRSGAGSTVVRAETGRFACSSAPAAATTVRPADRTASTFVRRSIRARLHLAA